MPEPSTKKAAGLSASAAFAFVLTLGVVNLFADTTYEGGSSINGPFLGMLGAGAVAIGLDGPGIDQSTYVVRRRSSLARQAAMDPDDGVEL